MAESTKAIAARCDLFFHNGGLPDEFRQMLRGFRAGLTGKRFYPKIYPARGCLGRKDFLPVEIRQKTSLFAHERPNRARDLLRAFRKVAQILQNPLAGWPYLAGLHHRGSFGQTPARRAFSVSSS